MSNMNTNSEQVVDNNSCIDERYRVYASISFAILLIGIGVPLWWQTTAVPRVPLPYTGISALSNLNTSIRSRILIASSSHARGELLTAYIKNALQNSTLYKLDISYTAIPENRVNSAFSTHEHEKIASTTFNLRAGDLLLLEAPNLYTIVIGSNRTIFFPVKTNGAKLVQILSQVILREKSLVLTRDALTEPTKYSLDEENRRRFPASSTFDILLTLVNPHPEQLKVKWNLAALTKDYLEPFLNQLSLMANFSVKSQWLYLMPLDITPKQIPDSSPSGKHYALLEDILPQLITPLEKKLASQVSLYPCINLVMYIVPCDGSPLHIYTRTGHRSKPLNNYVEAFLSPRWGGVVISNPPPEACKEASRLTNGTVDVIPNHVTMMGVFLAQLKLLLGIPQPDELSGVIISPLDELNLRAWELDALLRIRAIEQLTSAKLTLQSLAQLLEKISNIVITDTVGNRINYALELVQRAANKLHDGELEEGFVLSKEAFLTAEAAFTDPSLLALLYFPDDQKYAVYIPLFLPVMIPVLLSLKNIKRYFF
ncbi:hypothetical protein PV327_004768 [Microctonus hyperodae]|uniref:GPI transamidase component PIG-S n=1 Tax=Microctonus hyperodae TaxID=165561 RepID=A0AA39FDB4_MICHY|nr:hypothetical protein PV327_004768 [Microctonus hyperodae]